VLGAPQTAPGGVLGFGGSGLGLSSAFRRIMNWCLHAGQMILTPCSVTFDPSIEYCFLQLGHWICIAIECIG